MDKTRKKGLTTTKAPFIENALRSNKIFIEQPYDLYSEENQLAWKELWKLIWPKWEKFANKRFLSGLELLHLKADCIPKLDEVNQFLKPLTGFQAKAVSGYIPPHLFFDCLKNREFPTTITIRDSSRLDYLPEPDIFHDIAGHVPMHTDKAFANVLAKLGSLAEVAVRRSASIKDPEQRLKRIANNLRGLARFFWFTIEFGLMRENDRICVYGSGLLSSAEELEHSVTSPTVQRHPFQLEWVVNQAFTIDTLQPLLFTVDSFEHLFDQVKRLERWLLSGKLDNVSGGAPEISLKEIQLFLEQCDE